MKEKTKEKKDIIIKIILIAVIILLLVHNCLLVNKKKNAKTPSGNVNIIEITCVDNNKCDIKDIKDNSNNKDDNSNTGEEELNTDNSNGGNGTTNSKKSTTNGNSNKSNSNSSGNNSNNNNSSNNNSPSGESDETTTDTITEPDDEVFVKDKKLVWSDSSDLKIFSNSVYNFEEKVAPESSNTYQFIVKNSTSYKVKYNISFTEVNPYHINMKYKLKKNNAYVVSNYVSFNELNISEQILNSKSSDTFYLDWKWVSSDNDNEAGKNHASYSLKIDVNAESIDD